MSLIMKKFVDYVFGLELDFDGEPYKDCQVDYVHLESDLGYN